MRAFWARASFDGAVAVAHTEGAGPEPLNNRDLLLRTLAGFMVHFAGGMHRLATLDLDGAAAAFTSAELMSLKQPDPFWTGGSLARRAVVAMCAGAPMETVSDATISIERSARSSNWAEHGSALAIRAVANTRLGRFADADNDTESTILSARRADSTDALLAPLPAAMWRRAVRGDDPGVAAIVAVARQHQMVMPYPEFVAMALLSGVDAALEQLTPRWSLPKRCCGCRSTVSPRSRGTGSPPNSRI